MKQAILAASVALSLAAMAPANAAQRLDRYVDVIVTLNDAAAQSRSANLTARARGQGYAENRAMAAEVARQHGVKASRTYGAALTGVAARVSESQLAALRADPMVANTRLGGSGSKTGTCTSSGFTGTVTFHQAICNAKDAGVVFAVAAGNDGADAQNSTPPPMTMR